jgi:hypothetical protein
MIGSLTIIIPSESNSGEYIKARKYVKSFVRHYTRTGCGLRVMGCAPRSDAPMLPRQRLTE